MLSAAIPQGSAGGRGQQRGSSLRTGWLYTHEPLQSESIKVNLIHTLESSNMQAAFLRSPLLTIL